MGSVSCSCRTNATQQQQQQPERRGWLFSWRTPFTAPPLAPGCPPVFSHCGRRAPRPVHCRKRMAGKLRRDTLWRPGFAALTNREGCPLHNGAGWPRVAGNLMPACLLLGPGSCRVSAPCMGRRRVHAGVPAAVARHGAPASQLESLRGLLLPCGRGPKVAAVCTRSAPRTRAAGSS